jgi:hypothetical protein
MSNFQGNGRHTKLIVVPEVRTHNPTTRILFRKSIMDNQMFDMVALKEAEVIRQSKIKAFVREKMVFLEDHITIYPIYEQLNDSRLGEIIEHLPRENTQHRQLLSQGIAILIDIKTKCNTIRKLEAKLRAGSKEICHIIDAFASFPDGKNISSIPREEFLQHLETTKQTLDTKTSKFKQCYHQAYKLHKEVKQKDTELDDLALFKLETIYLDNTFVTWMCRKFDSTPDVLFSALPSWLRPTLE